jgi:uncharacterized protein YozE (UPF0346 family)
MHRLAQLREIQEKGAPAQSQRAIELLTVLEADADHQESVTEADALFEAYLHDPYLTKDVSDNRSAT